MTLETDSEKVKTGGAKEFVGGGSSRIGQTMTAGEGRKGDFSFFFFFFFFKNNIKHSMENNQH